MGTRGITQGPPIPLGTCLTFYFVYIIKYIYFEILVAQDITYFKAIAWYDCDKIEPETLLHS